MTCSKLVEQPADQFDRILLGCRRHRGGAINADAAGDPFQSTADCPRVSGRRIHRERRLALQQRQHGEEFLRLHAAHGGVLRRARFAQQAEAMPERITAHRVRGHRRCGSGSGSLAARLRRPSFRGIPPQRRLPGPGADHGGRKRGVIPGPGQRVARIGQLAVAPRIDLDQALAGAALEMPQQCAAQPGPAIGRGKGVQKAVHQVLRGKRVGGADLAAHHRGQRPQPAVDGVQHVDVAMFQRLHHRLSDQLRLQFRIRNQAEGVVHFHPRRVWPADQGAVEMRPPAALVGNDLAGDDVQVGQVFRAVMERCLALQARGQRGLFSLHAGEQQRHQLRRDPRLQRVQQLRMHAVRPITASVPARLATDHGIPFH